MQDTDRGEGYECAGTGDMGTGFTLFTFAVNLKLH